MHVRINNAARRIYMQTCTHRYQKGKMTCCNEDSTMAGYSGKSHTNRLIYIPDHASIVVCHPGVLTSQHPHYLHTEEKLSSQHEHIHTVVY